MSKVIQVLEAMANNSTIVNEAHITELLVTSELSDTQRQAISSGDVEALVHSSDEVSKIKFVIPLIPAEDDEPSENEQEESETDTNSLMVSAS